MAEIWKEIWVAEYSLKQNAFHMHTVDKMIEANLYAISHKTGIDYIPFAIGPEKEVRAKCIQMEKKLGK
jgi:hypothetical protein